METAFLIVVPRAGQEPKYLHQSVPKENNAQTVFEMQFDFFGFMMLSQQVALPSFCVCGNTMKENHDSKKDSGITVVNEVIMQFSDFN